MTQVPPDQQVRPEPVSPNDALSCLWSKDASEKCRVGLTDTILFEKGIPFSWYYTGKTGEILKKRNVDMNVVSKRWMKISSQYDETGTFNKDATVAIMKQHGGVTKFLGYDAWEQVVTCDKAAADTSILSVHCFVAGIDKTYYRNKYTLKDNLGRCVTSTSSYVFRTHNPTPEAIQVFHDKDQIYTDSKVVALRNIMDLATNTVVRYMEKMLNCKILNLNIDYAIDKKSQLWILWMSDMFLARTTNLMAVADWFPHRGSDVNARMSWAGRKYDEEYRQMSAEGRSLGHGTVGMSMNGSSSYAPSGSNYSPDGSARYTSNTMGSTNASYQFNENISSSEPKHSLTPLETSHKAVTVATGADQVYEAMNVLHEVKSSKTFKVKSTVASTHVMLSRHDSQAEEAAAMSGSSGVASGTGNVGINSNNGNNNTIDTTATDDESSVHSRRDHLGSLDSSTAHSANVARVPRLNHKSKSELLKTNYPDPFKCKGDYCKVTMHAVGPLFMDPDLKEMHATPLDRFFSKEELQKLQKQRKWKDMMHQHVAYQRGETNDMPHMTMKSLIQARRERRGVFAENVNRDSWQNFPITPRHAKSLRDHLNELRSTGALQIHDEDSELSLELKNIDMLQKRSQEDIDLAILEAEKLHVDSFTKTLPQYYEEVAVCRTCYHIYHLLDWAREVLSRQGQGQGGGQGSVFLGDDASSVKSTGSKKGKRVRVGAGGVVPGGAAAPVAAEDARGTIIDGAPNPEGVPRAIPFNPRESAKDREKLASRDNPLDKSSTHKRLRALSANGGGGDGTGGTEPRGRVTWKDYSVGPEGGSGQQQKGGKKGGRRRDTGVTKSIGDEVKFSDLDDYLRSGAAALATKKSREKEALMRDRLSKIQAGSETGSDPYSESRLISVKDVNNVYHGRVLFACAEGSEYALDVVAYLEAAFFEVTWLKDGRQAVSELLYRPDGKKQDVLLVDRHLDLDDAIAVTAAVRDQEREARQALAAKLAARGRGDVPKAKRLPIICFTNETTPEDLKQYMKADMDGCVSFPVNKISLLDTIRAAVPHHLAEIVPKKERKPRKSGDDEEPLTELEEFEQELKYSKQNEARAYKLNSLGVLEGSTDSATAAAASLPVSAANEEDYSVNGVVQIDADTRVPYMVLDASKNAKVLVNPKKPFFNVVVCHDVFDTAEKMKIFFKPIVERYLGMQVLVWNYPGQAFTEFRSEQLLNNEYHAICLNELLGQVGNTGTGDFDTDRPFFVMGYGFGVAIASFYLAHFRVPNVRGMLSVNGFSYLDSYLAGVMHDCINVFQATPPSRPDLPVYFFSRFLFCKEYLAKVSVPLALNIYTAIHNPISSSGRLQLCKGVLQTVDMRSLLKEIELPLICMQSTQDSFVRPLHMEPFVMQRAGEVRSIHAALQDIDKTCIIWVKSGHELFQENKKQVQLLFEQILTGFFETHDVTLPTAFDTDRVAVQQGLVTTVSNQVVPDKTSKRKGGEKGKTVEDNYINNILGTMNSVATANSTAVGSRMNTAGGGNNNSSINHSSSLPQLTNIHHTNNVSAPSLNTNATANTIQFENSMFVDGGGGPGGGSVSNPGSRAGSPSKGKRGTKVVFNATDPNMWAQYSTTIAEGQNLGISQGSKSGMGSKSHNNTGGGGGGANSLNSNLTRVFDPTLRAFERQDSVAYGKKDKTTNPAEYDEIKEYMGWRLKRNKKRLQRLQGAARIIQAAFRAYVARQFVKGIRRRKAAMIIQRCFRGWIGRCAFMEQAKRIWAAQRIQRAYRGYLGRKFYFFIRLRIAAAANIQRVYRGHRARLFVDLKKKRRYYAACKIQALFRRNLARKVAFRRRYEKNSAICIQRIFRGHLGKRKAVAERDKFIFSRSQTQGIEFGRQMLLEHKLHATRLQSDVTLLMQEKVSAEEMVEALLDEISSFEGGVRTLEKEMHQLSKVESEAAAYMDEESKYELREQKIRLDKEFGDMLSKIAHRKDMLTDLERKLNTIDKSRQGKEEELRTLERKLVVLLEEQQNELNAIKRKQDIRGAMLAASHTELTNASAGGGGADAGTMVVAGSNGGGGGGGGGGKLGGAGGGGGGPSLQEKKQAAQLMQSTETLMKFGFMSMSMTYFSSLNMIKALRTVSAQDTVMAALADVHSQRAANFGNTSVEEGGGKETRGAHLPELKRGQLPGQEQLRVSAWSVDDVAKWLQTLSLGQYCEAFIDAAIDGEFLYDINDDDLKNTLGIEHRLHRKKILNCVHRLKVAEALEDSRLNDLLKETGSMMEPIMEGDGPNGETENPFTKTPVPDQSGGGAGNDRRIMDGPKVSLLELFSLVRHSKVSLIKEALDYLPSKKFDKSLIKSQYIQDHGTVYVHGYESLAFHINKVDEAFGNTMLMLACQNGNTKLVKYLIAKGANPNAQNKVGQTAAHFANAFKFYEVSQWIFENGGDDTLANKYGLTPYDGLLPEGHNGFDDDNQPL